MEPEARKGSHRGLRPPPENPAIYCTPSCSRARITASAPRMVPPSSERWLLVLRTATIAPPVWQGGLPVLAVRHKQPLENCRCAVLQPCRVAIATRVGRTCEHPALGITHDQLYFPVIDA